MLKATYRFPRLGTINFTVRVRSTGYYRVNQGWQDRIVKKNFLEIFWCISGTGEFVYNDGSTHLLTPEHCCCYFPGDCHHITAIKDFEFCWVTFDGEKCTRLIEDFSLERSPWYAGECPQDIFAKLRTEIRKPGTEGEITSGAIGYELLSRAKTPNCHKDTMLAERFIAVVENKYDDHNLTIDAIAEELNVHRSTLIRNVAAVCGESPQNYLTEYRLRQALSMLQGTDLSIKEISEKCGYSSPNYFGKVFMRVFGKTPSEMRTIQ